jgi:hypothetical protein
MLFNFKNLLGRIYETNEELARFDHVFDLAGWTDQGIRWTREFPEEDDEDDVFIVKFTNKEHTTWDIK